MEAQQRIRWNAAVSSRQDIADASVKNQEGIGRQP